jgi:hypothetical protein
MVGHVSDPVNEIVAAAIDDLQPYWSEQFPAVYGSDYSPVGGGVYAVVPSSGDLPPCVSSADDIAGNAFYCPSADVVAWDGEALRPALRQRFDDFVAPVVWPTSGPHDPSQGQLGGRERRRLMRCPTPPSSTASVRFRSGSTAARWTAHRTSTVRLPSCSCRSQPVRADHLRCSERSGVCSSRSRRSVRGSR